MIDRHVTQPTHGSINGLNYQSVYLTSVNEFRSELTYVMTAAKNSLEKKIRDENKQQENALVNKNKTKEKHKRIYLDCFNANPFPFFCSLFKVLYLAFFYFKLIHPLSPNLCDTKNIIKNRGATL